MKYAEFKKEADGAVRQAMANRVTAANESPAATLAGVMVSEAVTIAMLTRLGKRLGLPLRWWHWYLLRSAFGRPNEHLPLIKPQTRVKTSLGKTLSDELVKALADTMRAAGAEPTARPFDREAFRRLAEDARRSAAATQRETGDGDSMRAYGRQMAEAEARRATRAQGNKPSV